MSDEVEELRRADRAHLSVRWQAESVSYPPPNQYPPTTGSPAGYPPSGSYQAPPPHPTVQYAVHVIKWGINGGRVERMLNDRALQGWRLAYVFAENPAWVSRLWWPSHTVMIFERRV